ncbi:hypothetical protein GCM10008967_35580 [Bacillus carboniphilus]|uniref:ABC transmembrane type-1 domain-containing protein n=1 Tax=Bacillus carboniphilus TaxID=86663 RepID=A0ABN0WMV6_9BACI
MSLGAQLFKLVGIWLFVTVALILIVLLPRGNPQIDYSSSRVEMTAEYAENITTFSWGKYWDNIQNTFGTVIEEKSLGQTVYLHSVEYEVWRYFSKSLIILIPAIFVSIIFGILKGYFDFRYSGLKYNIVGRRTTSFFLSVPDFFLIICIQMGLIILFRFGFPEVDIYGYENLDNKLFGIFFLSMYPVFYIARVVESILYEETGKDYVRTAMSKGISISKIIWRHMFSNGLLKIISHFNTIILYLLSNLFIVEFLIGYRGAAYRFYRAFNVKKQFAAGDNMDIEIPLVIEYIVLFTFVVLCAQILSKIAAHFLLAKEGAES